MHFESEGATALSDIGADSPPERPTDDPPDPKQDQK
jgi:hypothetical protein